MTTETESIPNTKNNKKKRDAKKKRQISKHILRADRDREALERARSWEPLPPGVEETAAAVVAAKVRPDKTSPGSANRHTKDMKEAAGYLSNWKGHRDQWKFSKNTQSWLVRHMYQTDRVAKGTFAILLDYLRGLQGKGAKERIVQEATRRALRYKQYEEGTDHPENEDKDKEKAVKFAEDTKDAPVSKDGDTKKVKLDPNASEEEQRWSALKDHDKRKEYKRARKILEALRSK